MSSTDLLSSLKQILVDIKDYKYLAAAKAHEELLVAISVQKELAADSSLIEEVQRILDENAAEIELMVKRSADVKVSLNMVSMDIGSDEWKFGAHFFGVTTHYSIRDDRSLNVHIEGDVDDLPFFEQLAVINEIDLFKTWVPFCNRSSIIKRIGPGELAAHFQLSLPFLSRETAILCYGADCLQEHDSVVLNGKSICCSGRPDDNLENYPELNGENDEQIQIPFEENTFFGFHAKMEVKDVRAVIKLNAPTKAKSIIVFSIDLKANLPQFVINFAMKNLAGLLLYLLQKQASQVAKDTSCPIAVRIRDNTAFYVDWLLPKLRDYCSFRGWEQPVIVALGEAGLPASPSSTSTPTDDAIPPPV